MLFSRRRLLGSVLAAPSILKLSSLTEAATCTPTGLGPSFTAPGSLPSLTTLPNPFVLNNGTAITTKVQWLQRRAEMKQLVRYFMMGHEPPPSPVNFVSNTITTVTASGGTMTKRVVNLTTGPGGALPFSINIYIPTVGAPRFPGPYPTLLSSEKSWSPVQDPGTATEDASIGTDNLQTLVSRGYVIAEFGCDDFSDDLAGANIKNTGIFPFYSYDANGVTGYDWAYHISQSWATSRVIDYLVTLSFIDRSKIAVVGHSRGGVTATLCAAFDERIAMGISNAGGIAYLYRYVDAPTGADPGGGKNVDVQVRQFGAPGWYNARLAQFIGNTAGPGGSTQLISGPVDRLPFDWHQVIGMIAPRAFLCAISLDPTNLGTAPQSTAQALIAAQPMWTALGVSPSSKTGIFSTNINSYGSAHEESYIYWKNHIDFMDFVFFGIALPPDVLPPSNPSHQYAMPYVGLTQPWSWSTPTLT